MSTTFFENGTVQTRPPIRFSASRMTKFLNPFSIKEAAVLIPLIPAPTMIILAFFMILSDCLVLIKVFCVLIV